jgi:hypothetical protein
MERRGCAQCGDHVDVGFADLLAVCNVATERWTYVRRHSITFGTRTFSRLRPTTVAAFLLSEDFQDACWFTAKEAGRACRIRNPFADVNRVFVRALFLLLHAQLRDEDWDLRSVAVEMPPTVSSRGSKCQAQLARADADVAFAQAESGVAGMGGGRTGGPGEGGGDHVLTP